MDERIRSVVAEYERCRQDVAIWEKKRNDLIGNCSFISEKNLCLVEAYKEMQFLQKDNYPLRYTYNEVVMDSDAVCDNCRASYKIKINELSEARHRFGNAKRALSAVGKAVIKMSQPLDTDTDTE